MTLKIRHGILEVTNLPNNKKSAIIINNEIIIAPGIILQPYIRPELNTLGNSNLYAGRKIFRKLQQSTLIDVQNNSTDELQHLNSLNYQITFNRSKLINHKDHILFRNRAKLLYLFNCSEISRNLHQLFCQAACQHDSSTESEVLLSSFLILSICQRNEREAFNRFLRNIGNYLRFLHPIKTLDDVLTMCTPFGLENFYKTVHIGKVSNVVGRDCLFVLSNTLPLGCEGSAVFNSKLRLIGIIISTSFQRQHENVNLTLAANFLHLLKELTHQIGIKVTSITVPRSLSSFSWERSIVAIEADGTQGTGTLVKVHNKKFILTCSHVVFKSENKIYCRNFDGKFESNIIWKNPTYNKPYDVAILTCPSEIPHKYFVRLSTVKPTLGQSVYNAGFPFFVNFQIKYDFSPSIFQGRIIKCSPGAILSDGSVHAGQSGGPMFDENGHILGVCVSNIKVDNVVYPNINTAVPIYDIRDTLERYALTNDEALLNNLVAKCEIQRIWSLETPPITSKL